MSTKHRNLLGGPCGNILSRNTSGYKKICKNPATKPHLCPFKVEIREDRETKCRCCSSCEGGCRAEV